MLQIKIQQNSILHQMKITQVLANRWEADCLGIPDRSEEIKQLTSEVRKYVFSFKDNVSLKIQFRIWE